MKLKELTEVVVKGYEIKFSGKELEKYYYIVNTDANVQSVSFRMFDLDMYYMICSDSTARLVISNNGVLYNVLPNKNYKINLDSDKTFISLEEV